jgi:hypothetical protein
VQVSRRDGDESGERPVGVLLPVQVPCHESPPISLRDSPDESPATDAGAPERRIDAQEGVARQADRKHPRRLKVSNEIVNVGTTGVSTAATVLADVLGSATAGDAAGIAGNALGLVYAQCLSSSVGC